MFGNTNTNTFGSGSLFGQNAQQPQQQPQTSGVTSFGGWSVPGTSTGFTTTTPGTTMFGTTSSPTTKPLFFGPTSNTTSVGIFGGQQNSTPPSTATTPSFFGGGTTGFTTGTGSTGFFQNSSTNSAGTPVRFDVVKDQDTVNRNGVSVKITVNYQCITMMSQYKEKSMEELRLEDYQLNRHKKSVTAATGLFGASAPATTPPVPPPQPTGGLIGSLFGQPQQQQWPSTTQNTNITTGTTSSGLFTGLFNSSGQQQKPNTNLFGGSTNFGTTTGATNTAFNFTGTTTQQGQGQTTSIFGSPQTTTSAGTTTPAFSFGPATGTGTCTTGTINLFGNQTQQQQPQKNAFNFTAAAATVAPTGQGLFGSPSTAPTTKPIFGTGTGATTTAPAAPSTGFFTQNAQQQQQPQQNTNFFGNFGTTGNTNKTVTFGGTTTAPAFGSAALGTSVPAAGTSTQQPSTSFGFNAGATTRPALQPAPAAPPTMSFGTSATMFGGPSTSSFKMATAPGTYGSTGGFVLQPSFPMQAPRMPMYQHPQYVKPGPITFGTSAYKDSPLFYNLHEKAPTPKPGERRKRLEMPPADESVLKYVSKSSSSHHQLPQNFTSLPLFKRQTSLVKGKNSSISKFKIFDGFEDEDFGVGIDILSPKTDVKKLNLQSLEESLGWMSPGSRSASSPSLARISTELVSGKNSKDSLPPPEGACSSSSGGLLGNRRVRFLLPPKSGRKPGQEKDDDDSDDDNRLGSHFGSSSVSLLEAGSTFYGGGGGGAGDCAFLEAKSSSSSDESVECSPPPPRKPGSICGLISRRDSYFVKPSVQQLDDLVDKEGNCFVEGFEVGRRNFGRIKFLCPVNVKGVNIDELVNFRHKEVVVYPDDSKKPGIGKGLNVPAEIRLERVWPVDKETNELVRGVENVKEMGYEERLKRSCKRMKVQFISYDAEDGIWCFRVDHF